MEVRAANSCSSLSSLPLLLAQTLTPIALNLSPKMEDAVPSQNPIFRNTDQPLLQGDALQLEPDTERTNSPTRLGLIGKLISERLINKQAVQNILSNTRNPLGEVCVEGMAVNVLLYTFEQESNKLRVGPW